MAKPLKKYCLALDLKDDPQKINTYIKYHQQVWQEINQSIKDSGIQKAEIYHTGNRLFMILEVDETFSFDRKACPSGKVHSTSYCPADEINLSFPSICSIHFTSLPDSPSACLSG